MKQRMIDYYMDVARRTSQLSYAEKLKVGAILVKDDKIVSIGYNGSPSGWSNELEYILEDGSLKTKPEVIHAEQNCLYKLAKSNESGKNSYMFITHSPCIECSKGIYASGIKSVFYEKEYRCDKGVIFLENCGIKVCKV